jgi:hypothetical protein
LHAGRRDQHDLQYAEGIGDVPLAALDLLPVSRAGIRGIMPASGYAGWLSDAANRGAMTANGVPS